MSFSVHYISRISRRGNRLTIYAYDLMRRLEEPFDDSLYNEENEPFNCGLLLNDLAKQCGFANDAELPPDALPLYYSDISGKKCREILDSISRRSVGVWYCSNSEQLRFCRFLSADNGIVPIAAQTSPVYLHSKKGPFGAVYGENSATGEIYSAGTGGVGYTHILRIAGPLITRESVQSVMSLIAGRSYQAFYCSHMGISDAPEGITAFYFDAYPEGLISCHTVVHFSGGGVYAEARAADICEDDWDYTDLTGYELRRRVERFREYGSTVMTDKGLGVIADKTDDPLRRAVYYFSRAAQGVTDFDGAIIDRVMPTAIESVSDTAKRIIYDGVSYILEYKKGGGGSKTDITLTREET